MDKETQGASKVWNAKGTESFPEAREGSPTAL